MRLSRMNGEYVGMLCRTWLIFTEPDETEEEAIKRAYREVVQILWEDRQRLLGVEGAQT